MSAPFPPANGPKVKKGQLHTNDHDNTQIPAPPPNQSLNATSQLHQKAPDGPSNIFSRDNFTSMNNLLQSNSQQSQQNGGNQPYFAITNPGVAKDESTLQQASNKIIAGFNVMAADQQKNSTTNTGINVNPSSNTNPLNTIFNQSGQNKQNQNPPWPSNNQTQNSNKQDIPQWVRGNTNNQQNSPFSQQQNAPFSQQQKQNPSNIFNSSTNTNQNGIFGQKSQNIGFMQNSQNQGNFINQNNIFNKSGTNNQNNIFNQTNQNQKNFFQQSQQGNNLNFGQQQQQLSYNVDPIFG